MSDDDDMDREVSGSEDGDTPSESSKEPDSDDLEDAPIASSPRKGKAKEQERLETRNVIVQTAFDAYFTYSSARAQTSTNTFSHLVLPLAAEEYSEGIGSAFKSSKSVTSRVQNQTFRTSLFSRFLCEMLEGFNILCYGLGSKREILNQFATGVCAKRGHVVVANAFQPEFSLRDLLNSIDTIPGIQSVELTSSAVEKQALRIHDFFSRPSQKRDLYIIIHNVDAATLRPTKARSILSILALNSRIHIIASIDHINAPLLWSSSETSSRKISTTELSTDESTPSRGFAWLWHDVTTLASYDFELAFTDKALVSGAHGGGSRKKADTMAAQSATAMSETAALHILASVTQRARKLFSLLGSKQLEHIEEAGETTTGANDLQQFAMGYDILFNMARDNFVATNDTALRALLSEFRDHHLVVSGQGESGSGEILWIPLRKERLTNVLGQLHVET